MAKIKVRSGRGTRIIEVDDNAQKWQGEDSKKHKKQEKKQLKTSTLLQDEELEK